MVSQIVVSLLDGSRDKSCSWASYDCTAFLQSRISQSEVYFQLFQLSKCKVHRM